MEFDASPERTPPHNIPAERALLGCIIIRNDALFEATEALTPQDFFEPWNGDLFRLLKDLIEADRSATRLSLLQDIQQDADVGGIRASVLLARIEEEAPPPTKDIVRELANGIASNALKRRMLEMNRRMMEDIYAAPPSIRAGDLRDKYDSEFSGLFRSSRDLGMRSITQASREVVDRLGGSDLDVGIEGIGLAFVEELLGPLVGGKLYIIGGSPGSGKTALAQHIGENVARPRDDIADAKLRRANEKVVAFFSGEMERVELAERSLARKTGTPLSQITGGVNYETYTTLRDAIDGAAESGFYVDDDPILTVDKMRTRCLRKKRQGGLHLVIADHLILMRGDDRKVRGNDLIDDNLIGLKSLAKELGVPIICLTQLLSSALRELSLAAQKMVTSESGKVEYRRPTQNDLLYEGSVDRAADAILLVNRFEHWLERCEPEKNSEHYGRWQALMEDADSKAEAILTKRRQGKGHGVRRGFFDKERACFAESDPVIAKRRREVSGMLPLDQQAADFINGAR